ncbi:MAG: hypothetical protein AAGK23_10065 [Pseudomonadota bacterium]
MILITIFASQIAFAQEPERAHNVAPPLTCSGGMRTDVVMAETGETFVVSTIARPAPRQVAQSEPGESVGPRFEQSVVHQDGENLITFEATNLFEDISGLTCEERLSGAHNDLANTIAMAKRLDLDDRRVLSLSVRMQQLSACLQNEAACNVAPHYVAPSDALRSAGADRFDALIAQAPVTFTVFLSALVTETHVYDPGTRTRLHVETDRGE